ncbi:hypothetical protein N7476_006382 [Penicillium atrosanguineum]|uniref:Uncharacterized protein n=1 Tax=Penicillium atrosanguineum TaxID=1132637 RepID=A0A9W9PXI2_9EURO|nr:hypothetical protein N7526_011213 [Penicillium atrosanguineum]KAJ5316075.1 hypothetical protein N7476_006382 [Penicillium atrosanguineum]
MASARASNDPAQEQQSLPILHATCDRQQRSLEDHRAFSSISGRDRDQQDMSIGSSRPEEFDTSSQSTTACSNFDQNTITTTPATSTTLPTAGETTTLHVSTEDDTFGTLKFAPMMKRLFQDCKTDRGEFLRAIREAKAAFPTGQGWEAAIATKEENADMRDRMKIYHRFECYNIYWHVVEAGFHTGTYWIRDMRTALANKLCQDFPKRFQNQKTANKCLNWVDQGCKYHEWAGLFSSRTTDLGYLIALPLDVPHSAYAFPLQAT